MLDNNVQTNVLQQPPVKEAQEESQPWTTQSKERVVQCSDLTGITGIAIATLYIATYEFCYNLTCMHIYIYTHTHIYIYT